MLCDEDDVRRAISDSDEPARRNAALAGQATAASGAMSENAAALRDAAGIFTTRNR